MISTTREGALRTIVLDRPERRNALTRDGLTQLQELIDASEAAVLYLTGAGEAFCAGADLDTVETLSESEAVAFARTGQRVARALAEYDGAVVAGVDGAARGGGVELAVACDLRVATPEATFAESGVELGLFGAWGGTARLPAIVGQGHALDLALSGRVIDAEEALSIGLVSRVVDEPRRVADSVAEHDPIALWTIKRLVRAGPTADAEAVRKRAEDREAEAFGALVGRRNTELSRDEGRSSDDSTQGMNSNSP